MLGRVIKGQNNVPVARIMACVEVTMRVGPASDFSHVSALVDALLDWPMGHVVSVCDNREFFQLRPIESSDFLLVRNALRVACGMEDPRTVDWATVLYFDNRDPSTVPDTYVGCALGRSQGGHREVAVSLVFGVVRSAPWESLFQLSRRRPPVRNGISVSRASTASTA